jgi:hypothetical protein
MKYMIYLISFFMSLATYSATLDETEKELLKRQFSFPSETELQACLKDREGSHSRCTQETSQAL